MSSTIFNRILLVSTPGAAASSLTKILNLPNQPTIVTNGEGSYFATSAFVKALNSRLIKIPVSQWTEVEQEAIQATYQTDFDALEAWSLLARARRKTLFATVHPFWLENPAFVSRRGPNGSVTRNDPDMDMDLWRSFHVNLPLDYYNRPNNNNNNNNNTPVSPLSFSPHNATVFADEYLRTWRTVFVIRHPVQTFPRFFRALRALNKRHAFGTEDVLQHLLLAYMNMYRVRMLYEQSLLAHPADGHTPPIILDASDIVFHTEIVVVKLCHELGLDGNAINYEWAFRLRENEMREAAPRNTQPVSLQALLASLAGGWTTEFGADVAALLKRFILDSVGDFQYLWDRRLK
ncbi:hypothetical protein BDW59DRAFT_156622 [Aspergillus cavernicola]|uniref:Sulfotransferase domain-containing protein n=1 Tax=Aspergillus cavernicola TaxID=176166 RepID=A0ABR4J1H1_9EURO